MKVKVISFYTPAYSFAAADLHDSCKVHGVDLEIVALSSFKSWAHAVCSKPQFILERLRAWKEYDGILWTDADSTFARPPDFSVFDGYHFGAHTFQRSPNHPQETLTGTMFFANVPIVEMFLIDWAELTPKYVEHFTPEQASLAEIMPHWKDQIARIDPGPEWCFIHDDMREMHPHADPVVLHYQLSRQTRHAKKV